MIELKPNPKCKDCFGKGWLAFFVPERYKGDFRELRPCHCVKAVVKEVPSGVEAKFYLKDEEMK